MVAHLDSSPIPGLALILVRDQIQGRDPIPVQGQIRVQGQIPVQGRIPVRDPIPVREKRGSAHYRRSRKVLKAVYPKFFLLQRWRC
jgi:hypothetical protein